MRSAFWMRSKYLLANDAHIRQMAHIFFKFQHSCLAKFISFRVGETEPPSAVFRQLFALRRNFGDIDPKSLYNSFCIVWICALGHALHNLGSGLKLLLVNCTNQNFSQAIFKKLEPFLNEKVINKTI